MLIGSPGTTLIEWIYAFVVLLVIFMILIACVFVACVGDARRDG